MNNCCFTGYLVEKPIASHVNNVLMVEFTMVIYNYRRTKSTGEKSRIPTYIHCEAWHTGAETIEKLATKGTKMTIQATAKNIDKEHDDIVFRISEFDICRNEDQDEWNNWE